MILKVQGPTYFSQNDETAMFEWFGRRRWVGMAAPLYVNARFFASVPVNAATVRVFPTFRE